jgi:hypothetical protein
MKKICMLAAGLMMLSASAETLTVFGEVDDTNILVPISIDMLELANSRTQILYPAEKLAAMKDMDIKSITFYTDGMCTLEGGLLTLSMGETSMSEFEDDLAEGLTVVGTATITTQWLEDETWETQFQFTTPYHYNGGNLVFDVFTTTPGHGSRTEFLGVTTDYISAYIDLYRTAEMKERFMPKTTFTYEGTFNPGGLTEKTGAPLFREYTIDGIQAYFVEIQEVVPSTIYYRIKSGHDGEFTDWAVYEDVLEFTQDGWYYIEAYAVADGMLPSDPNACEFTVSLGSSTGLNEMATNKQVADVRYYNMTGQEIQQPNGMTIVVTTYTDGSTSTVKTVK